MKKFIAICITCFVFLTTAFGQMDRNIAPQTSKFSAHLFGKVNEIVLPAFTKEELASLDYNDSKNGHAPAVARNIATNINLNTGTWTDLPNGGRVWRIEITGKGALAVAPLFDRLYLPPGASLHFYMPLKQELLGAFTNDITPTSRAFCPGLIHGESCMVEYFEPAAQKGKGILSINKVGYAYRDIKPLPRGNEKSGSGPCEVNVVCPEGDNWSNQVRSVVRIFIVIDNGNDVWCSGSMINNVRQDCTPYVLSAEHCTENGVSAASYEQWVFYYNFQSDSCDGTSGPQTDVVNGCNKKADSEDQGGASGSDFLLVQLIHAPILSYNIFYSGWDITNTAPDTGVGIHHPQADIKKISTFLTPAVSTVWPQDQVAQNTHWEVVWAVTQDGEGVTEPGSSGSPLYNGSNGLIVGHLTGGGSCCAANGCLNGVSPTSPDYYGKLAYDWTSDGVSAALQLKPWLDPDNTGTTVLQGKNTPCGSSLLDDAGIQAITEPNGTVCAASASPVVVLRNFGSNTLTSVTLTYKYDNGASNVYNWTGNLLAGSTTDVDLPSTALSTGAHTFTVTTSSPNGGSDPNSANNTLTSNFFISSEGGNINLSLTTDNEGSKTTWQITDVASNVLASGGPYPNLVGGTTYNIPVCMPAGCYKFTIFSASDNGMTAGEDGSYTITSVLTSTTLATLSTPAFGAQEADNFCVTAANGIAEIPAFTFSVTPNPSNGQFNIAVGSDDEKSYRVYDITGRLILDRKTTNQNFILDLTNQSKGVYILQLETEEGTVVQKLVLK